ncbi:hypothetical protein PCL_07289 [Purpureocillium lilacinum]|uniref:Uncharacterized protein n=1 Tax=Purpureocillium lilacinum TaxID=33203 RepID=A0A2U3DSL5_PURLI|nr:hypothetical protein PCL_07289 [Purpureocillium lilacinum]
MQSTRSIIASSDIVSLVKKRLPSPGRRRWSREGLEVAWAWRGRGSVARKGKRCAEGKMLRGRESVAWKGKRCVEGGALRGRENVAWGSVARKGGRGALSLSGLDKRLLIRPEASFERYSYVFENTENGFHHLVEIKMRTDGDAEVREVENLHDIPQLWSARQKMKERIAGGCLKLCLPKENFRHLLEHFHIDPCVLHLLQFNCYGVRGFSHDDNGTTFYIGTDLQGRNHTATTRAQKPLQHIPGIQRRIAFQPFVALMHLTNCADSMIYEDLNSIRVLESKTGRGLWAPGDREQNSNDLTELSKEIESPNGPARRCSASMGAILSALAPLKRRIEASRAYVQYLDTRLSSQSSVVFALMTSEDACIAKEIAEASRDIARLTGKDSYSMKTVAIITMAFLPATFFAALFSMPLLDWREPVVIQEKFWVYIGFTISSTILVFVGWPEHLARRAVSFVSDRSACVRYQHITTSSFLVQCGLPQGSPVSPILFLLYTEPIYRLGNPKGRFGYADDTASFAWETRCRRRQTGRRATSASS